MHTAPQARTHILKVLTVVWEWKVRRGKTLTEQETRDKQMMNEAGRSFARALQIPPRAAFHIAYLSFAAELLDGVAKTFAGRLGSNTGSRCRDENRTVAATR